MSKPWTPFVELDLETVGNTAFQETIAKFNGWAKSETAPPFKLQNGWYDVTPEMAEDLLRRNGGNRKVGLQMTRKYYETMKAGEWKRTGQPVLVNQEGKLEDAQHRMWASYLGKVTFPTYIITDVPVTANLFAYIDDCKPRTAADALYTSGNNGLSVTLAAAIKLAWRYENGALAILTQPKLRDLANIEVVEFARQNPDLNEFAHTLVASYGRASNVIGSKPVAAFFGWKVVRHYGPDVLDPFMDALGSGALLAEDSPILALRNRLLTADQEGDDLRAPRRLALVIKAFLLHISGQKMGKKGLSLRDNEAFPRIEPEGEMAQAAE